MIFIFPFPSGVLSCFVFFLKAHFNGLIQVLFLLGAYFALLSWSSEMISDGSELLLLVPSIKGIIGSVVLPILGAVPDGAMVLFSCLGDNAVEQINVGVGALAGSTIMLLTLPWFLSIMAGRVNLQNGQPNYKSKKRLDVNALVGPSAGRLRWASAHLFQTGVTAKDVVQTNGKIMMATSLVYLIIQIPAFVELAKMTNGTMPNGTHTRVHISPADQAHAEKTWVLVALVACFLLFVMYLAYCVIQNNKSKEDENSVQNLKEAAMHEKAIDLGKTPCLFLLGWNCTVVVVVVAAVVVVVAKIYASLFTRPPRAQRTWPRFAIRTLIRLCWVGRAHCCCCCEDLCKHLTVRTLIRPQTFAHPLSFFQGHMSLGTMFAKELESLRIDSDGRRVSMSMKDGVPTAQTSLRLETFLRKKFLKYDKDGSGELETSELRVLFSDLGEAGDAHFKEFMNEMDKDHSGKVSYTEFKEGLTVIICNYNFQKTSPASSPSANIQYEDSAAFDAGGDDDDDDDDDDDEDEEMPEEFADLPPKQQMRAIIRRSLYMMAVGTFVVLLVSDPAVDVLSDLGTRIGINTFVVSFLLAPMASNASELVAAFSYAKKKTASTMAVSLSTLEGAGIMNNTFTTAIFFIGIHLNPNIEWRFSAETIGIIGVQLIVGLVAQKKVMTFFHAFLVLSLYPLSLVVILMIKNHTGLQ